MLSGAKSVARELQLGKKAPRSMIYARQPAKAIAKGALPAAVTVFCFYLEAVSEASTLAAKSPNSKA
jgi:hypothetical protein